MGRPRKMTEEKRLNVKLEAALHERFRLACEHVDVSMSDAVAVFVEDFIAKNLPKPAPQKGDRRTAEHDESPSP